MYTKKILLPTLVLLLGIFFAACQKENIETKIAQDQAEGISARATAFTASRDLICTLGDNHCNPHPMGLCLILFPPQGAFEQEISADQARGLCFVDEQHQLTVHLLSDLPLAEDLMNSSQGFTLNQDFVIPALVLADLDADGNLPNQVVLNAGTYPATVGETRLEMTVPTNAGKVNFVIWYNTTFNPLEEAGYLHNKWIADLVNDNYELYSSLSTTAEVHGTIATDMEDFANQYGLGEVDFSNVQITGESTAALIDALDITDYEKIILKDMTIEVNTKDLYTIEGLTGGIRIINNYEKMIKDDENVVNHEALLGMLAVLKHSAMYWTITSNAGDTPPAYRMKKGWSTALSDGIGFVKGFLGGGWLGGAIRGVIDSAITYFTYDL